LVLVVVGLILFRKLYRTYIQCQVCQAFGNFKKWDSNPFQEVTNFLGFLMGARGNAAREASPFWALFLWLVLGFVKQLES
jgi:hypothetical protein